MAEDEASTSIEDDADERLHCAIVDMVDERGAAGGAEVANLAALIAESLVDVILLSVTSEKAVDVHQVEFDPFVQRGPCFPPGLSQHGPAEIDTSTGHSVDRTGCCPMRRMT